MPFILIGIQVYSQVSINADGSPPNPSAGLDVKFNNKGLLPPRMTNNQINAIVNPAAGLMVFCTDCANGTGAMAVFSNGHWNSVVTGCPVTEAPVAGLQIPYVNQITWNWNTVAGATGYRWNTEAVYNTSTVVGATPTYTEAGLGCNTLYKRYAWAYGACGYSSIPVELSQTTTSDPPAPAAGTQVPSGNQISWNWLPVSGAIGYKWNTTFNYATATDMGTATIKTETGLTCNTAYTRYVWAYGSCGYSTTYLALSATTTISPSSPLTGTQAPSLNQIIWNWNTVSGATGYKWNTTNNYATAVDMGPATTKIETGLSCNTAYSRFVWAYDACGASLATTLTSTTLSASVANPLAGTHVISYTNILWKWNKVAGATGYKWGAVNNYNLATDVGSDTAKLQINLVCNSQYTTYVWAYNSCGVSAATLMTAITLNLVPEAPLYPNANPSITEITWSWTPGLYSSGSKWNTINDYNTAIDVGSSYMHTETGLTCNTLYTRYVWDYNFCTVSPVTIITDSTLTCINCPPFTITHLAGAIAPVTKTVRYGAGNSIPGEPTKCWITQNLGADHQATAVYDATEASAGWYWQFNRKQGYKHDGTTRTPNTTWIYPIVDSLDWQPANDPCALELGGSWRLPTITEWSNVVVGGGWIDWNGPWNSGLKIHASGNLGTYYGDLNSRGSYFYYWSSTQWGPTGGYDLVYKIGTNAGGVGANAKEIGASVRCLRDN